MGIENIKQEKKNNVKRLFISILKVAVLLAIVIGIPLYIFFCQKDLLASFKDYHDVVAFLQRYETESIFVYIGLQVLQIVISVIPGQVFQMAAGFLYGFWAALLYAMIGAIIGTAISYYLAKILGRDFLHLFFGEEKMSYYVARLNSKQAYTIVFLLYLIPGIPKDMVSYAAGVSEMRFKPFLLLSVVGRLPGMIGCLLMGMFLYQENYIALGVVSVIAVIAFLLCILFRKKINSYLDHIYARISKK
ncbi:MAG: TVP38/TMEM64 family protein [Firmicutes bacterium]|nr:TVP38/TMEM64 family protein [Bacillota bacterium]